MCGIECVSIVLEKHSTTLSQNEKAPDPIIFAVGWVKRSVHSYYAKYTVSTQCCQEYKRGGTLRIGDYSMRKLRLHNPRLEFVPYPSGRIHVRWNGPSGSTPAVDMSVYTMCGRLIPEGTQPQSEREMDTERICGNCRQSLMTYGPQVELVESEVQA